MCFLPAAQLAQSKSGELRSFILPSGVLSAWACCRYFESGGKLLDVTRFEFGGSALSLKD